jgi:hypothetical protein
VVGRGPYQLLSARWLILTSHHCHRAFSFYRTTMETIVFFLFAVLLIVALVGLRLFQLFLLKGR